MKTPYYLIDESKMLKNMLTIKRIQDMSGAKCVLALKCFSTWSLFPLMSEFMSGTTSSSLYEAKLGYEKFGKETHAYCVGWSKDDVVEVSKFADKIIFNSLNQLDTYYDLVEHLPIGIRVNPGISNSEFDLANPARKYSRLGVVDKHSLDAYVDKLSGLMFHYNCENDSYEDFATKLEYIGDTYGHILQHMNWMSLGGGLYFCKEGYPIESFAKTLLDFANKFAVQIYLEPGESAITMTGELVASVVDIVHNEKDIAIIDACIEGHMLDLLIYRLNAKIEQAEHSKYKYIVAGRSCLAGDVFGEYFFADKLKIGDEIRINDAAGYTMVKKNWFNGLQQPSIVVKRLDGSMDLVREFSYEDFRGSLS